MAIGDENKKIYFLDDENIRIKNNTGGMHVITDGDILNKRLSSSIHSKKYSNEMKKLESVITEVKAIHMIKVTSIFTVTAKAEQMPRICNAIGLLSTIGSNSSFLVSLTDRAFIMCSP
mgnify:CR=1 FL=1